LRHLALRRHGSPLALRTRLGRRPRLPRYTTLALPTRRRLPHRARCALRATGLRTQLRLRRRLLCQQSLLLLKLAIDHLLVLEQRLILLGQLAKLRLHGLELLLQRFYVRRVSPRRAFRRGGGRCSWRLRLTCRRGQLACTERAAEQQCCSNFVSR
jgi:hypothetical protein